MTQDEGAVLTTALKSDRAVVLGALVAITLLAWAYLWLIATQMSPRIVDMQAMPGMAMEPAPLATWSLAHALLQYAMWTVMMVGMMTPSVAPTVLIYAAVARQSSGARALASPFWFLLGYFGAWSLFAALATGAQWALERAALLSPMLVSSNRAFGGVVLIGAGVYQWTSWKGRCLSNCQAPLSFIQRHGGFRPGALAATRLGVVHGLYCVGCCWSLMALLFVLGVMNLAWVAVLAGLVLLEKLVPQGRLVSRLSGAAAVAWGLALLMLR